MKSIFVLFCVLICVQVKAQYQILLEGEYTIGEDSLLYRKLDWYGYYVDDSIHCQDRFRHVQLRIAKGATTRQDEFFPLQPASIISTSIASKSVFLLGVKKGEHFEFDTLKHCANIEYYTFNQGVLMPGRVIGNQFSVCLDENAVSISVFGNVNLTEKGIFVTDYHLVCYVGSIFKEQDREDEIAGIINLDKPFRVSSQNEFPFVYAIGNFDNDMNDDFIIWYEGIFYVILNKKAIGPTVIAKSHLCKPIEIDFPGKGHWSITHCEKKP